MTAKGDLKVTCLCRRGKVTACKSHEKLSSEASYCKRDMNLSCARCDKVRNNRGD